MKLTILGLLGLCANALANSLIVADESNFEDIVIKSGKPSFVKFYAPWCFHCKEMKQSWEDLADDLAGEDIQIVELDADANKSIRQRYGIASYPQVKLFKPNELSAPIDYSGTRTVEAFNEFLKSELNLATDIGAPSMVVQFNDLNIERFVEFKKRKALVLFTNDDNEECDQLREVFETVAGAFHKDNTKVLIGEVKRIGLDPTDFVRNKFHIGHYPTIVFIDTELDNYEYYDGELTDAAFVTFINEKIGVRRAVDGTLDAKAGIIPQLEEDLQNFVGKNVVERRKLVSDFVAKMRAVDVEIYKEELKYYAIAFNQFNGNNQKFFISEREKYEKMVEDKSVDNSTKDTVYLKLNFLNYIEKFYTDETWRSVEEIQAEIDEQKVDEGVDDNVISKDEL